MLRLLAAIVTITTFADKPNVVLIMADDLGCEAIAAYGGEDCRTPNLDRLASEGVRFTNCFANPLCTPSRAKIMTGLYNVRNYVRFGVLDRSQHTFAHQLKEAGYATGIAGKWQLGKERDAAQHFGFDEACLWQHFRGRERELADGRKVDTRFVNPRLEINGKPVDFDGGQYGPQICTDFICHFIDKHKDRPFLAYYPMVLTHCPFDPTPDSDDWDPKRAGSTMYKGDQKAYQRHFVDMVQYADKLVGQIDAQLRKSGVRDNTILIFTGDNGTDAPIKSNWNGRVVVGGKGRMADEGIRVPLIASWPNGISNPGRVSNELVDFADFMPTLCEVSGASLPANYPGDGKSIAPVFGSRSEIRKKHWVYIWYKGKVIVRNANYSLLSDLEGRQIEFVRYDGPFEGRKLSDSSLREAEKSTRQEFAKVITNFSQARQSHLSSKGAK